MYDIEYYKNEQLQYISERRIKILTEVQYISERRIKILTEVVFKKTV